MSTPSNPPAAKLLELAARAMGAGDFAQAEAHLERVLVHDPADPTALHHLALRAWLRGQTADARGLLERALRAAPDDPAVLTSYATMLHELGEPRAALDLFLRLLALDSTQADIWNAAGICFQETGQPASAVEFYLRALTLRPNFAEALSNLGAVLTGEGDHEAAIKHLRQALELCPSLADAHHNLGIALRARFEYAAAIASLREALRLKPDHAETVGSLGELLSLVDDPTAEATLRQAVQLRPADPEKHWNLALELLKRGDFPAGWREYEWRWQRTKGQRPLRPFPQPLWRGGPAQDLRGKTLLLHAEQGFGDTLQFLRFLPSVLALGPRIVLELPRPLLSLATCFARQLGPNVQVIAEGGPLPPFDLHTPLMTLPLALGVTIDTVPGPCRFTPPAVRPPATGLRIGLAWAGNPRHNRDRERSVPTQALLPLFDVPNCTWISLQIGPPAGELVRLGVAFERPPLHDFLDTAAVLDTVDLVLTVDSAVAHLAASQGVSTWVLLPYVAEWRWHMPPFGSNGPTGNPWYPAARLFRQRALPDGRPQTELWAPLIAEVASALEAIATAAPRTAIP